MVDAARIAPPSSAPERIATAHAGALRAQRRPRRAGRGGRRRPRPGPSLRRRLGTSPRSRRPDRTAARGATVDLVHLCTPPASHAPLALRVPAGRRHVLVEKPPTLSLAELDTLIEAAAGSGAHVATVFQHRFGAGAVRLRCHGRRRAISAGRCWRPAHTQWYRDDAYYEVPWRGTLGDRGRRPDDGPRHPPVRPAAVGARAVGEGHRRRRAAGAAASRPRTCRWPLVTFASGAVATSSTRVCRPGRRPRCGSTTSTRRSS